MAGGRARAPRSETAGAAARLHQGLVGDRELVGSRYLADPALRGAYEAELAPRTRAALAKIFAEVAPGGAGAGAGGAAAGEGATVRRVVDLGSGTGAAGAAVRTHFGPQVEVVAVDRIPGPGVTVVADLVRQPRPAAVRGRFDIVVAAHLLNELAAILDVRRRAALVRLWCDELLADGGMCVILEPALRETSRGLLEVRDELLSPSSSSSPSSPSSSGSSPSSGSSDLSVVAPCFWQGPCPALVRARDWCHDATAFPGATADRSRVDFSYLVLRRGPARRADPTAFRVVSDPLREKGRLRLFGCGTAGRHPLVRLSRDRTPANAAFDQVQRGDIIAVARATPAGDGLRVGADTAIAVPRPGRYVPAE